MQTEITQPGPLLDPDGCLTQVGWSRQPMLDCNLENAAFYPAWKRPLQKLRVKRWDYYGVFTPQRFFSATIADIGYVTNIFVYVLDYQLNVLHEDTVILPPGRAELPRNSELGESVFQNNEIRVAFRAEPDKRLISVDWPSFCKGMGVRAELALHYLPQHESMNIIIPIPGKRFYHNRKINCLPAEGILQWGDHREEITPTTALGGLDWGRGVWQYQSFWNWASASGYIYRAPLNPRFEPRRCTLGLNLGSGFGDLSRATENAIILDGRIHKLDKVEFNYDPRDFMRPWLIRDNEGRLDLMFTPFFERIARTDILVVKSEGHQIFGKYAGRLVTDEGEEIRIDGLVGFAEEHRARW